MFESEATEVVKKWLERQGYITKKEVRLYYREADIVGFKKPNKFVAIEVKGEIGSVIYGVGQAISYAVACDESYLAIEPEMLTELKPFLDKIPIGIIFIIKNKVKIYKRSEKFNPGSVWKLYLKELFETGKSKRPLEEGPYGPQHSDTPEMKRLKRSLTTETLWFWILKLLSKTPRHAYILRKEIKNEFGFMPGNVTCYKVLYFLKKGGYVIIKDEGRRKIYYITDKGRKELLKAKEFMEKTSAEI